MRAPPALLPHAEAANVAKKKHRLGIRQFDPEAASLFGF